VFALEQASAAQVVTRVAALGALRDIAVVEPDIEDVVARLYAAGSAPRQGCSITSTANVPGSSAS
jgi:ABC-2 type transport system ATP-binding protein